MPPDTALLISAWQRPRYFRRVLASWAQVPEIRDLRSITVALGRSDRDAEQREIIAKAESDFGRGITIRPDSDAAAYGPGMHRALGEAIGAVFADDPDLEFLVCSEEDVTVADDLLRYMAWARALREEHPRILVCEAHNPFGQGWHPRGLQDDPNADPEAVRLVSTFHPWTWSVWRDRWEKVLEPEWDWDENTGPRPDQHGYDWQINRIMQRDGYAAPAPDASRTQNIGRFGGVYAHPDPGAFNATQSRSFRDQFGEVSYRLVT